MPRTNGSGSVLLTNDQIAKESLRLLKNDLVFARLVHRNLEREFGKIGDTISIKLPYRVKSASGRQLVKQPLVDKTTTLKIDRQEHVGLEISQIDRTLSLTQFSSRYLASGISQIAHQIDLSIAQVAARQFFFGSGTPGTAVTTDNWADASAFMSMVGVPDDGMLRTVLNPLDAAALEKGVKTLANEQMVKTAIERHWLRTLSNMDAFKSAQLPMHTVGALGGTPTVDGGGQTGTSLLTQAWSNSITGLLNIGDCFTIGGVYEVNPRTYESTGRLQRFVVTNTVNSTGGGAATISISPAINDGSLTTADGDGNQISLAAYQNVTAAPADNAPITVIGTAGTTYRQSVAFHRDAIALAMIDIELPDNAPLARRVRDPATGISLTMVGDFDIIGYNGITRIDALWGVKAIYPELGHRIWSDDVA
jgi:hypothetical protein